MRGLSPATPYYRKNDLWVPGGGLGPTPFLLEDFMGGGVTTPYTSTADWISDRRGIYSTGEDLQTSQMVLDQAVGCTPAGTTQTGRYDMLDQTSNVGTPTTGRCGSYTIGRNLNLPGQITEGWFDAYVKSQSTFKTLAPSGWGCTSAAAYKTIFIRTDVSRYNLVLGIFGETAEYTWSAGPGNQEPADYPLTWLPFDGNWHHYQMHVSIGTGANGVCNLAVDGTVVQTNTGLGPGGASYIYGIAFGRNMNQGPSQNQSIWFGPMGCWLTDPWGGLV